MGRASRTHNYGRDFVIGNASDLRGGYRVIGTKPKEVQVDISNFAYTPSTANINTGDTIHWEMINGFHTVTSTNDHSNVSDGSGDVFDSGFLLAGQPAGDDYYFTFTTAGTYLYYCTIHPSTMFGTIVVTDMTGGREVTKGEVPISRNVRGPSSLRGRSSAYTPSQGGNPLDMGK